MKKSTKILLILFIITLIPVLIFSKSIILGIFPVDNKIVFKFDTKAIIGLCFAGINIIIGSILFFKFLNILSLDKVLFFTSAPLVIVYGLLLFFLAYLNSINNDFSKAIKSFLNITPNNTYNLILWVVIISVIFISLLFFNYLLVCRPVSKVERVVSRLGDGIVRNGRFNIGGGKQFNNIEHGLNKINNNYLDEEGSIGQNYQLSAKRLPKQFYRVVGRSGVVELERGKQLRKRVAIIKISVESNDGAGAFDKDFDVLNSQLNIIAPLVKKYGGYIERYLESGLIVVFGKIENAIECEQMIFKVLEKKSRHLQNWGVLIRVALDCEVVIFALSNESGKKTPRILSDLSFLDKLGELAKFISVKAIFTKNIIDELPLNYRFKYRYVGNISKKDKDIYLFEDLESYSKDVKEKLFRTKGCFEKGIIEYEKGEYHKASVLFEEALREYSADRASYVYYSKSKDKAE